MNKYNMTNIVLIGNALLLIIGTIAQASDHPLRHLVLSILFVTWIVLFALHAVSSGKREAAD